MAPEIIPSGPRTTLRSAGLPAPFASVCLTAALLFGMHLEGRSRTQSADSAAHCQRISRLAEATIPFGIGDWVGRVIPIPPAAVALLRPNALVTRGYDNVMTGESASVLFAHCSDARDLLGHYPPVCYQARGLILTSSTARDWHPGGVTIQGMRYRFTSSSPVARSEVVVDNFMVLPDGRYGRDMDSVDAVAKDPRLRRMGVAEVQVVTEGTMSDERRDEVFRLLVERIVPLLQCTGAGTERD